MENKVHKTLRLSATGKLFCQKPSVDELIGPLLAKWDLRSLYDVKKDSLIIWHNASLLTEHLAGQIIRCCMHKYWNSRWKMSTVRQRKSLHWPNITYEISEIMICFERRNKTTHYIVYKMHRPLSRPTCGCKSECGWIWHRCSCCQYLPSYEERGNRIHSSRNQDSKDSNALKNDKYPNKIWLGFYLGSLFVF